MILYVTFGLRHFVAVARGEWPTPLFRLRSYFEVYLSRHFSFCDMDPQWYGKSHLRQNNSPNVVFFFREVESYSCEGAQIQ